MHKIIKTKGFTLIELLVVIAIIGILSTIVLVSLGKSREKANVGKVVAQLSEMRSQSELYFQKHHSYGAPVTGLDCSSTTFFDGTDSEGLGALIAGMPDGYRVACYASPIPGSGAFSGKWAVFVTPPNPSDPHWCTDESYQVVSNIDPVGPGSCNIPPAMWP